MASTRILQRAIEKTVNFDRIYKDSTKESLNSSLSFEKDMKHYQQKKILAFID
jgi:hypothetical protein